MKRPGDMKRRRQAAYCRGWNAAMKIVLSQLEAMVQSGDLPAVAVHGLRAVCTRPPPDFAADLAAEREDRKRLAPRVEYRRKHIASPNSAPWRGGK